MTHKARCYFCKGQVENRRVRTFEESRGKVYIIDNVPAEQCTRCVQRTYPGWVARELDRIVAELLDVPVHRFEKPDPTESTARELVANR